MLATKNSVACVPFEVVRVQGAIVWLDRGLTRLAKLDSWGRAGGEGSSVHRLR